MTVRWSSKIAPIPVDRDARAREIGRLRVISRSVSRETAAGALQDPLNDAWPAAAATVVLVLLAALNTGGR